MSSRRLLTTLAAVAIAAGSLAATTGGAAAKASPPHYKPLICIFFPSMRVCGPAMAVPAAPKKTGHKMMKMTAKPKMAPKKY